MKRQRTVRSLSALAAVAGAAVLVAGGPLAGTAAAQNNQEGDHHKRQIGYICDDIDLSTFEFQDAHGYDDCEPVNGAPFVGPINRPFYIAEDDSGLLVRCEKGIAEVTDEVWGFKCILTEPID